MINKLKHAGHGIKTTFHILWKKVRTMPLPFFKKKLPHAHVPHEKKIPTWWKWLKKITWFCFKWGMVAFAFGVLAFIVLLAWYSRGLPDPNKIMDRSIAQSTKIYDSTGKTVLYEIHGDEKRTLVKLEDIPLNVQHATIAAEDAKFYSHSGFDVKAIIRTVINDVFKGQKAGASTITQQFVKNAILTNEKRISRKVKELILSYQIEQKFTKPEILQMYLNEIPYGSTSYGVQSASQTFFGKDAKDLTLAESACIAGIPNAPSYYSPYGNHLDALMARKDWILDRMVINKFITEEQAVEAKKEVITFREKRESMIAPHFVEYVREQLGTLFGDKFIEQGGLKVTTTLDLPKQVIAEQAVLDGVNKRGKEYNFANASLVAMDPKTGQILAMVGSKEYFGKSEPEGCTTGVNCTFEPQYNVAVSGLRQPGSSMKPLVYAAAFEKGYTPDTIVYDVNTIFKTDGKNYEPKNYSFKETGPVTMRKALQGSLNIAAVKTLYLVGVDRALNFFDMMGYSTFSDRSRFGLAVVLGGGEVYLLEHVAAFSVFPSEGTYRQPASILKVEDAKGNILYQFEPRERKALDPNVARTMNNVLSDNNARSYVFGPSSALVLPGRVAAAKTGTTNDFKDAWTMGYTPSLVAGVWVGNSDNSEMKKGADGSFVAAPIWQDFMNKALKDTPAETFTPYTPVVTNKAILNGSVGVEKVVRIDKFSGKLATDLTPASAVEEKTFKEFHDTLYYLDKDNPQGPIPTNPAADPQFASWEGAVKSWVERKKKDDPKHEFDFITSAPPTEYDDVHTEANRPTVFLTYPQNNATISSANLSASVSVAAPRGIQRVEYYVDDQLFYATYTAPFNMDVPLSTTFVNGYHRLTVKAFDDVDNSNQVTIDLNVMAERVPPSVTWVYPTAGTVYMVNQFPVITAVQITDVLAVKKVNFYSRPQGSGGDYQMYGADISPTKGSVSVPWPAPGNPGTYELMAQLELKDGNMINSVGIVVIVQ